MQKFDHVLLASDFDNTLVYTQSALDNGTDIPPMCPRNREALDYFIQNGGLFAISTGRALPAFMDSDPVCIRSVSLFPPDNT